MFTYDVIVVGAGAAGLFCAAHAAACGKHVAVLEGNAAAGKKIRISGGGRCNFTNRVVTHHNFVSENPDFARSALARYTPDDFIALVDSYGIAWHEKTLGQLFCDGSAQQVIDMLLKECCTAQVEIHYRTHVEEVRHDGQFVVCTSAGNFSAENVVVATGGLSIPSLGASDIGYRIARSFGHHIIEPMPALVPLVFPQSDWRTFGSISGVSTPCIVKAGNAQFRENILFTHKGLSGPAILQISSYARTVDEFTINLLPDISIEQLVEDFPSEKRHLGNTLRSRLPQRLLDVWPDDRLHFAINSMPKQTMENVIDTMQHWTLPFHDTEGYAKAEVTSGGVDTRELSSKTMESRIQAGLYFIGEVVDVTGWLGGYNFQWAWSSGYAAGEAIRS